MTMWWGYIVRGLCHLDDYVVKTNAVCLCHLDDYTVKTNAVCLCHLDDTIW